MKLTATILKDGEHRRVFFDGINLLLGKSRRESMEDGVVEMEDFGGFDKLGSVPVVMSGENRGFREMIHTEYEGLQWRIGGNRYRAMD